MLDVNVELINYFKDLSTRNINTANRIEDRPPRIKCLVDELVKLGLIIRVGTAKETRGTGIVDIFQFTEVGHVMAWVVESMNPDKREYAENQIYELFQNNYKQEPSSSIDKFCSTYYRKCKERGLFRDLIECYMEVSGTPILRLGRRGLARRLMTVPKYDADSKESFWNLWNDSLGELDKDTSFTYFIT